MSRPHCDVVGDRATTSPILSSPAWRPLLAGEAAARARALVEEIGEVLASIDVTTSPEPLQELAGSRHVRQQTASLADGWAGIALFQAYRALATGSARVGAQAQAALENAEAIVARARTTPDLFGGFTGVAWVLEHLHRRLASTAALPGDLVSVNRGPRSDRGSPPSPGQDDVADVPIEVLLLNVLKCPRVPGGYDLVSGLVGFGVYALERLPRSEANELLDRVVMRLIRTADRDPSGAAWLTAAEDLPASHVALAPQGYYNTGLAHGSPGVIALLASALTEGVARDETSELLEGAVRWLLSHRLPPGRGAAFPYWIPRGAEEPKPGRLAWCYGDPGVAVALLHAARALRRRDWAEAAVELAVDAATLAPGRSGPVDASLCHGSAGLAHIFNRLYQASGEDRLAAAARDWYDHTQSLGCAGAGTAGSSSRLPDHQNAWHSDPGFLTGAAGVGLSLLGGCSDFAPEWDRVLLTALPLGRTETDSP